MKAVILAGGYGTRLSEETSVRPKPMVDIGRQPILWHIMKIYLAHGVDEFIVCCGYKGEVIKQYFADYRQQRSDITFDFRTGTETIHRNHCEPWQVTLVDTGQDTMTGGRLKRVRSFVGDETFCLTYGDGVTDLNVRASIDFHRSHGKHATLTAIQPPGRFGVFNLPDDDSTITHFREKPQGDGAWINGGFFVLEPDVFDYIAGDATVWEQEPLMQLAHDAQLAAFRHEGFWQPMDTLRDKNYLESLWESDSPPWKIW
ncbi:glucose-1-phosphate cytidylyltransferase [Salisaeta longa]|uniref:glucose-1-phosphate cytidylyltransferase n=1 Tax=Salisaeta longa TaxID=503170 RepID=UPI0003B5B871|nr:glucose-1-phosphate cytidylyltransferase [Salisaeta longa]